MFVLPVLRGVESGHAVQRAEVEVASGTLEEHRVREADWTLQQGQVVGSTPVSASLLYLVCVDQDRLGLGLC